MVGWFSGRYAPPPIVGEPPTHAQNEGKQRQLAFKGNY